MQPVVDTNTQLYMCYMYYIVRVLYSSFHALVWHYVSIYIPWVCTFALVGCWYTVVHVFL